MVSLEEPRGDGLSMNVRLEASGGELRVHTSSCVCTLVRHETYGQWWVARGCEVWSQAHSAGTVGSRRSTAHRYTMQRFAIGLVMLSIGSHTSEGSFACLELQSARTVALDARQRVSPGH